MAKEQLDKLAVLQEFKIETENREKLRVESERKMEREQEWIL